MLALLDSASLLNVRYDCVEFWIEVRMSDPTPERPPRKDNRPEGPNMPGLKMGRSMVTWMLVIGLAIMLLMLFNQGDRQSVQIPFSEFDSRLRDGEVKSIVIEGDEVSGEFRSPQTITLSTGQTANVTQFKARAAADGAVPYEMLRYILDNRGTASVEIKSAQSGVTRDVLLTWFNSRSDAAEAPAAEAPAAEAPAKKAPARKAAKKSAAKKAPAEKVPADEAPARTTARRPLASSMSPLPASTLSASRMVSRDTARVAASSASGGSLSPG